ncbi:HicB family protein [Candidatus Magnetoovum chiemensis]|nr:HicB family protein [Candidatus Magnetoovum chiemensis]
MDNTIEYKGFIGSVYFSAKDNILHGKIEQIDDLVSYEGTSIDEIHKAFYDAVDDYISFCKEIGKEIELPAFHQFK